MTHPLTHLGGIDDIPSFEEFYVVDWNMLGLHYVDLVGESNNNNNVWPLDWPRTGTYGSGVYS